MTIPRLELTACVIGVRLVKSVKESLKLPMDWNPRISTKFFTDSMICCYWIKQEKLKFEQTETGSFEIKL